MALQAFSRCIAALKLPSSQPVAVAVSGGSDSIALTHLARQAFSRVVGVTVDHQLREESQREALRVGELVTKMGVEHRILTLDWGGEGEGGRGDKVQESARAKRYSALFGLCEQLGINVLMTGHHLNDQLETFLYRLSKGSGVDGLACMQPCSTTFDYPNVRIIRPLLQCTKASLVSLCRDQGLDWVEDLSNELPIYRRNVIRKVLEDNPGTHAGLAGLIETCSEARGIVRSQVIRAVKSVPVINKQYGYLTIPLDRFGKLSPPVAQRVLSVMLSFTSGSRDTKSSQVQVAYRLCTNPKRSKVTSAGKCTLIPINEHQVIIARQLPSKSQATVRPICVGETVLWDGRFEITLKTLEGPGVGERRGREGSKVTDGSRPVFYIRPMVKADWNLARRGVRKVRSFVLPHENVRGGLPVIVDSNKKVVLIPHFRVIDRSAGVSCDIKYNPRASLEDYVQYPLSQGKHDN